MSWVGLVGVTGLAVVVTGWLVVSFSAPSARRERIEWVSACGLYVVLLMIFVNLLRRALEADSTAGLTAFGFLSGLFGVGLLVCLVHTAGSFRARRSERTSATN